MPYRVEVAPQSRAGCKNKECKDAGIKIQKGELRFATQVTIQEHTSWTYKHWGCVTPAQVEHLIEECGGDTDMVDGYEELTEADQEKVKFALANGHVPDDDWKGDVECNRPGAKGFRVKVKAPKKKGKNVDKEEDEAQAPKPKQKRGRPTKAEEEDEDEEEAPAPKKARGKAKKAAVQDEEEPASEVDAPQTKVKRPGRAKKATTYKEVDEDDTMEKREPPKAKRGKKAVTKKQVEDEVEEPEPQKPKRGKKEAAAAHGKEKAAPQKRGKKKKAVEDEE